MLKQYNPNVNAQDSTGRTALHFACRAGNLKMLQRLIAWDGINTDVRTCGGETPLMAACQSGEIYVVGECLNNNFNPFLENSLKQSARDYASLFPNVYGHDLKSILDTAIEQWKQQVPAE